MSIAALVECSNELRRLTIAGSELAAGDFRLQRLVDPLRKSGAKAPVFNKVADAVQAVVDSNKKTSSQAMLDLGVLVHAILYTQGVNKVEGKTSKIESYEIPFLTTRTTARVMKPLVEALTSSGEGRYNLIDDAYKRGAFNDMRLIQPAIVALDDSYGELAEMMQKKILPTYGDAIAPFLNEIDLKGKRLDARKLELLGTINPKRAWPIAEKALAEGNAVLKVAALNAMAEDPRSLDHLIEQATTSKNKDVRQAALDGLACHDKDAAIEVLAAELKGKNIHAVIQAVSKNRSPKLAKLLLAEAEEQFELALAKDKKASLPRLSALLNCFHSRKEKGSIAFVNRCFDERANIAKLKGGKTKTSGADIVDLVHRLMYSLPSAPSHQKLAEIHAEVSTGILPLSHLAARKVWPPEEVYDSFAPYVNGTAKVTHAKAKTKEMKQHLQRHYYYWYGWHGYEQQDDYSDPKKTDPRWLDLALKLKDEGLILRFHKLQPKNKKVIQWLVDRFKKKDRWDSASAIRMLKDIGYKDLTKLWLTRMPKKMGNHRWEYSYYFRTIEVLPKKDLKQVQKAIEALPEDLMELGMEHLAERLATKK